MVLTNKVIYSPSAYKKSYNKKCKLLENYAIKTNINNSLLEFLVQIIEFCNINLVILHFSKLLVNFQRLNILIMLYLVLPKVLYFGYKFSIVNVLKKLYLLSDSLLVYYISFEIISQILFSTKRTRIPNYLFNQNRFSLGVNSIKKSLISKDNAIVKNLLNPNLHFNKLIAIIRIKGKVGIMPQNKKALSLLGLNKINTVRVMVYSKDLITRLTRIDQYISWGEINNLNLRKLLVIKGRVKVMNKNFTLTIPLLNNTKKDYSKENFNVSLIPFSYPLRYKNLNLNSFKLSNPRFNYNRKITTDSVRNITGYQGKRINKILDQML